jgi:hypothetical protein
MTLRGAPSGSSVRANAACMMYRSSCMAGNDGRAGGVDDIPANGGLGTTANCLSRYTVSGDSGDYLSRRGRRVAEPRQSPHALTSAH